MKGAKALHFLAAAQPLKGKTLDALGAPRSVGEVGDPMQINLVLRRHSGCDKCTRRLNLLRSLYDVLIFVLCLTAPNGAVALVAVCCFHTCCPDA